MFWHKAMTLLLSVASPVHGNLMFEVNRVCYVQIAASVLPQPDTFGAEQIKHVDPYLCTHLVFHKSRFGEHLQDTNYFYDIRPSVRLLKNENPELRFLWSMDISSDHNFSQTHELDTTHLNGLLDILQRNDLSGLVFVANRSNEERLTNLIMETKAIFDDYAKLMGTRFTLAAQVMPSMNLYKIQLVIRHIEFVVLETVKVRQFESESTTPVSGSDKDYSIHTAVTAWTEVVPPYKLVVTVPLYGTKYHIGDRDVFGGLVSMRQLCNISDTWDHSWDSDRSVEALSWKETIIFFEGRLSISAKARYVVDNNLGGIAFWFLDMGDFKACSTARPYANLIRVKDVVVPDSCILTFEHKTRLAVFKRIMGGRRPLHSSSDSRTLYNLREHDVIEISCVEGYIPSCAVYGDCKFTCDRENIDVTRVYCKELTCRVVGGDHVSPIGLSVGFKVKYGASVRYRCDRKWMRNYVAEFVVKCIGLDMYNDTTDLSCRNEIKCRVLTGPHVSTVDDVLSRSVTYGGTVLYRCDRGWARNRVVDFALPCDESFLEIDSDNFGCLEETCSLSLNRRHGLTAFALRNDKWQLVDFDKKMELFDGEKLLVRCEPSYSLAQPCPTTNSTRECADTCSGGSLTLDYNKTVCEGLLCVLTGGENAFPSTRAVGDHIRVKETVEYACSHRWSRKGERFFTVTCVYLDNNRTSLYPNDIECRDESSLSECEVSIRKQPGLQVFQGFMGQWTELSLSSTVKYSIVVHRVQQFDDIMFKCQPGYKNIIPCMSTKDHQPFCTLGCIGTEINLDIDICRVSHCLVKVQSGARYKWVARNSANETVPLDAEVTWTCNVGYVWPDHVVQKTTTCSSDGLLHPQPCQPLPVSDGRKTTKVTETVTSPYRSNLNHSSINVEKAKAKGISSATPVASTATAVLLTIVTNIALLRAIG